MTTGSRTTAEGRAAYESSSQDFNAGDLFEHADKPTLAAGLAEQGVADFELSAPVQLMSWYHDEKLFQEEF